MPATNVVYANATSFCRSRVFVVEPHSRSILPSLTIAIRFDEVTGTNRTSSRGSFSSVLIASATLQAEVDRIALRLFLRVDERKRHAGFAHADRDRAAYRGCASACRHARPAGQPAGGAAASDLFCANAPAAGSSSPAQSASARRRESGRRHAVRRSKTDASSVRERAERPGDACPARPRSSGPLGELPLRELDVEPLHRVLRLDGRRRLVELRRLVEPALAEQQDQPVRVFDADDRATRERASTPFSKYSSAASFLAPYVSPRDDARRPCRSPRPGRRRTPRRASACFGVELERSGERILDLAAETLRERLRDRDSLSVASQRIRVKVVCVRVLRRRARRSSAQSRRFLEQREPRLRRRLEVDARRCIAP